jgi:Arc/MetJ family transcription regulator
MKFTSELEIGALVAGDSLPLWDEAGRCVSPDLAKVYPSGKVGEAKIRRTNINLNTELVDAAAAVLGTSRTTDTVHAALRAVIDRAARERLAQRDFADLTPALLEQVRRPRQLA